jgi:hypothetical protein
LFGDLFSGGYKDAATAAGAGYTAGYGAAAPLYDTGRGQITAFGGAALQPQNKVFKSSTAGAGDYAAALGVGGGDPAAIEAKLAATPGYKFTLGQGLQAIDRGAASRGLTTSGNTIAAEQKYGAGLADQTYQNYVTSLLPYLAQQSGAANQISNINTGIGSALNSSYGNQGNLAFNTEAAKGNAVAAGDIAGQNAENSFIGGVMNLGGKLLGGRDTSGNIYTGNTPQNTQFGGLY